MECKYYQGGVDIDQWEGRFSRQGESAAVLQKPQPTTSVDTTLSWIGPMGRESIATIGSYLRRSNLDAWESIYGLCCMNTSGLNSQIQMMTKRDTSKGKPNRPNTERERERES